MIDLRCSDCKKLETIEEILQKENKVERISKYVTSITQLDSISCEHSFNFTDEEKNKIVEYLDEKWNNQTTIQTDGLGDKE